MRKSIISFAVILLATAGLMAVSSEVNAKVNKPPEVKDVEALADKLIEIESIERSTINDIRDFIKQVETVAAPYLIGEESLSPKEKTFKVLDAVDNYAENKLEGSTRDMVEGGLLHALTYHYRAGLNTRDLQAQIEHNLVSAVSDEANAWQKLENTLNAYYAYLAFMHHEGGTLAQTQASGSVWRLAEARFNDTEKLVESGLDPNGRAVYGIDQVRKFSDEIVESFTQKAKYFIDNPGDFADNKYFNDAANGLNEACASLKGDLNDWIQERFRLMSHCNNAISVFGQTCILLDKIKKLGTLESEE
jgi:hypothetical protein